MIHYIDKAKHRFSELTIQKYSILTSPRFQFLQIDVIERKIVANYILCEVYKTQFFSDSKKPIGRD